MALLRRKKESDIPRRRRASLIQASKEEESNIFRRNRTLTGTTSNNFDSTNIKSDLRSPRVHAHHLAIMRRKIFGILIIIILGSAVLWWLISNFTAVPIVVSSSTDISKSVEPARYEKVISDYLDANPLGRIQFLLDQDSLSNFVSSKLSEVAHVKQLGMAGVAGQTEFVVTMRHPVAGWVIGDKQYFVDAMGVPFEVNYFDKPEVQIVDESGANISVEGAIASNKFLSFVGRVVALSGDSGYQVVEAILPAGTTRQLEVKLKGIKPLIKLSIDRAPAEQVEDMSRAVKYFADRGQSPQYIDVRVSGKAFYR